MTSLKFISFTVYSLVTNIEYWTSGSDCASDDNYVWTAKDKNLAFAEVNWEKGQPNSVDGDCAFVKFSNISVNLSTFSLGNCATERLFVCELCI
jgi:hypothetical protein